ncbi:uncharacterized protein BO96DRAFT_438279 [Aspergillus niger CBS 101883]|uniref:Uncharacterized protein n=2 Tax=Aspergillus niger TaxID=5061 RepID=A2QK00_ASPNC|nr:uncharacterized protein BO96DRAFT_438279 [Aspergillus niger CBS 101883]XP_059600678.1 hypothetical protein An04g08850 [Aspergillus niger]PYH52234.1 hypothetical protein BO96DRAFT_438279 [Aspergillus niger CBS 101883]CAK38972.1 hypothetical protein An04g08850 [Aspergillus niger]
MPNAHGQYDSVLMMEWGDVLEGRRHDVCADVDAKKRIAGFNDKEQFDEAEDEVESLKRNKEAEGQGPETQKKGSWLTSLERFRYQTDEEEGLTMRKSKEMEEKSEEGKRVVKKAVVAGVFGESEAKITSRPEMMEVGRRALGRKWKGERHREGRRWKRKDWGSQRRSRSSFTPCIPAQAIILAGFTAATNKGNYRRCFFSQAFVEGGVAATAGQATCLSNMAVTREIPHPIKASEQMI